MSKMSSVSHSPGARDFQLLDMFSDGVGGMLNVSSVDDDIACPDEFLINADPENRELTNENPQAQQVASTPPAHVQNKKRRRIEYDGPFKKPSSHQKFVCHFCPAVFRYKSNWHSHQADHAEMSMRCVWCNWFGCSLGQIRRHYEYTHGYFRVHRNYALSEFC